MMITGRLSSFFNAVVTVGVLFVAFAFVCLCMSSWLVTSRIWQAIWRLLARCFPKRLNSALAKLSVWVPDSLLKPVVASAEKRQARVRPPKLTWQEAASAIGWISLILVLNYFGFLDSNASRPKTNRNTSSKTWPSDSPGFNPVLPPAVSEYLPDPKYKTYPQSGTTQVSRLLVSNSDGSLKVPFLVGWSRQHDPADKTAITLIRRDPSTKIVIRRLPKYAPLSETARLVGPGYPSEGDISRRWSTTPIIQGFAAIQQETNYRAGTADRVSVLTIIDTKTPFVTVLVDCLAVDWRSVTPSYQQVLQGFKESESAPELDR